MSFDCGNELIQLKDGEKESFTIKNITEGTICTFTIFTNIDVVEKYSINLKKMTEGAFLGGIFSNRHLPLEETHAGEIYLDYELSNQEKKHQIEI